ncbi:hypothetical protein Tco_0281966 [Tanacetum coccineum]
MVGEIDWYLGGAAQLYAFSHAGRPALTNLSPRFDKRVLRLLIMCCSDDWFLDVSITLGCIRLRLLWLSHGSLFVIDHGRWIVAGEIDPYLGGAARRHACSHGGSHTLLSCPALADLIPKFSLGLITTLCLQPSKTTTEIERWVKYVTVVYFAYFGGAYRIVAMTGQIVTFAAWVRPGLEPGDEDTTAFVHLLFCDNNTLLDRDEDTIAFIFSTTIRCLIVTGETDLYLGGAALRARCLQPWRVGYPFIPSRTRNSEPNSFSTATKNVRPWCISSGAKIIKRADAFEWQAEALHQLANRLIQRAKALQQQAQALHRKAETLHLYK